MTASRNYTLARADCPVCGQNVAVYTPFARYGQTTQVYRRHGGIWEHCPGSRREITEPAWRTGQEER